MQLIGGDLPLALVQHLDVAPQGDTGQHILGGVGVALAPEQGPAEADGEAQHLDAQAARDPEVPELVNRDQDRQGDQEGTEGKEQIHGAL